MAQERLGVHTLKGNPLTLIGPELKVGDKAPEFTVRSSLVDTKSSSDYKGKIRLINVVPSLYTGICDAQTRRFNEEAAKLGDQVAILTISVDLPSAQQQYCAAAGIDKVEVLSDHYDVSFGTAYGVLIKELRLLARSIFIIDAEDTIRYIAINKEMAEHPDYDSALAALRELL
ncbi:putative thiol peroxidase [Insulibacter thermoxylanivorax]|uniref:Thiol peroxidase n=1 Tax=Insulibacter thermoxylanivorax TaxID=2749268 RepID=A0A916VFV4_9BACL|nr:thiol peroxidase [Insulibacter thermoxylanivorax]GFR37836.1 putative thiol peroxidase [Insulibacter thermoxylanivorax]